ncbi:hypothetical protein CFAM422_000844 [Trichoderma lentiforme]|uniref:Uncharacterized protein n=1 Tax=Trichoderma lentiforme TaxID=1567552 RepID=A0A9P5CJ18_9HYPO|nr:hypothetical protein CFAM422_000844 [Trichoderma lentiforme]
MNGFNDIVFVWLDQPSPPSTPATLHVPSEPNPERRVQPQPRDRRSLIMNQLLDNIAHLQGVERPGPISASLYRSQFGYGILGEYSQPPPLAPGEERQEYDKACISRRCDEYATEAALNEFRPQVKDVHIEGKHPKVRPAKPKPIEKP